MEGGSGNRTAAVVFANAREADRRIAGLAAAARIVRELAEAGFAEVRLVVPDGQDIGQPTWRDLHRLSGAMRVVTTTDAAGAHLHLPGDRIVPAARLLATDPAAAGLPLDRDAEAKIMRATGKPTDGLVSRWCNRPVSRRISALLLRVPGIRPIHATAGTALLAMLMFAALIAAGAPGLIAGAVLFHAASVFDGVDGEIARATFRTSPAGAVLDIAVDVATNFGFILGLTLNVALRGSEAAVVLAAWGAGLFALGLAVIAGRSARMNGPFSLDMVKHQYQRRFPSAGSGALIRFMTVVSSRDFFALLFAVLVLVGLPLAVLALFAAAATVWLLFVLGSIRLPTPAELAGSGAAEAPLRDLP